MSGVALPRPVRGRVLAVGLSAAAGALVSLGVMTALDGGAARTTHAAPPPFTVALPSGWHAASAKQLAAMPSRPAAVLRRADGRGVVVIRRIAPVRASGTELVRELGTRLRARFPGFRPVNARFTHLRGGRAFVYTFERAPRRTVQGVAFAPAGGSTYELDTVVPGRAPEAARDAAAIVASFGP